MLGIAHLVFSVMVTRHGVRSTTSTPQTYTWADWAPVDPGFLTKHGYDLITYLGAAAKRENGAIDCAKRNVFVYADIDQRTLETAHAYLQGMCDSDNAMPVFHDVETGAGTSDPIFNAQDWVASRGLSSPIDSERDVRSIVGTPLIAYLARNADDFNRLQSMLDRRCAAECPEVQLSRTSFVSKNGLSEINGPVKTASTYAEDLFLEAAECRPLHDMGYNDEAAFEGDLSAAMHTHVLAYDFNARGGYNSAVRGGNLYAHIMSLMYSKIGVHTKGIQVPDMRNYAVALISGHDTQLGALGGILDAHWQLANGLVPDDMPPGGALVFDLYKDGGAYTVRLRFVYETLAQFRSKVALPDGVQSVPVTCRLSSASCDVPLKTLTDLTEQFEQKNYVQNAWTPMNADPTPFARLTDPAWSLCR